MKNFNAVFQSGNFIRSMSHMVEQSLAGERGKFLFRVADGDIFTHSDAAGIRQDIPDQYFEQGGLTGTVRPDNSDAVSGSDIESNAAEKNAFTV